MLRGSFIITQKENKGEYGAISCASDSCVAKPEWKWNNSAYDWDIYAHTFDQNGQVNSDGAPYRYLSSTSFGNNICTSDTQTTNGKTIYSNINNQISCSPNTLNAGNFYNFPAATAGSDMSSEPSYPSDAKNSICPKGWQLPPNDINNKKSYYNLIRNVYQIANGPSGSVDSNLLNSSAMSFVYLGFYRYDHGSLINRGNDGNYWSSTAYSSTLSRYLGFISTSINPQDLHNRARGYSIRCVSR